jgi:hypothetical protein
LLDLQALPDRERAGADILMDRVAEVYLSTSDTSETRLRRIHHLLLISHAGMRMNPQIKRMRSSAAPDHQIDQLKNEQAAERAMEALIDSARYHEFAV